MLPGERWGCLIWHQNWLRLAPDGINLGLFKIRFSTDWPEMGQIWDFLRSVSVHFGAPRQNVLNLILKSPRFVPFGANLIHFGCEIPHPCSQSVNVNTTVRLDTLTYETPDTQSCRTPDTLTLDTMDTSRPSIPPSLDT